jgi:hypothetical protein
MKMIVSMQGKTNEDRHRVTSAASDAVGDAGGYVLDYKQFSNLAICFTIELPATGFSKLRNKLAELKVILEPPTEKEIALGEETAELDIAGSLRIAFLHEEPDLRVPIPAVPG